MLRKWSVLAFGLVVSVVLSSGVAAEDKTVPPQQVAISLLVLEIEKADLPVFKLLLDVANSTAIQKPSDERFIHRLETASVNRIVNGLVKLKQMKVLAATDLIVASGRTGTFLSGGEFPVPTGSAQGSATSMRAFGTSLLVTPKIEGQAIKVGLTCEFSELLPEQAVNGIPGLRVRMATFDTLLNSNQTVVVGGEFATNPLPKKPEPTSLLNRIPQVSKLFAGNQPANNSRLIVCVSTKPVEPSQLLKQPRRFKQEVTQAPNLLDSFDPSTIGEATITALPLQTPDATNRIVKIPAGAPRRFVTPAGFVPSLEVRRAPASVPFDARAAGGYEPIPSPSRPRDLADQLDPQNVISPPSLLSQPENAQPTSIESRLKNMRSALVHLQAAGLDQQAADVKREIQALVRAHTTTTLKQKIEELRQLQSEILLLRQAIGEAE